MPRACQVACKFRTAPPCQQHLPDRLPLCETSAGKHLDYSPTIDLLGFGQRQVSARSSSMSLRSVLIDLVTVSIAHTRAPALLHDQSTLSNRVQPGALSSWNQLSSKP